jgi:tetratricopeptide (TPR) repeat protein
LDRQEFGKAEQRAVNFYELITKADDAERLERFEEQRDLLLKAHQESPRAVHPYILTRLADAYRSLHQFELARKYMEMAVEVAPPSSSRLVSLAIMQKNDKKLAEALKTLERASAGAKDAQKLEVDLIIAGYLIHAGKRDDGMKKFEQIKSQLLASNQFAINLAWFYAVADSKREFYEQLETALRVERDRALVWINQEVDIDKFRDEERFKTLVANVKAR